MKESNTLVLVDGKFSCLEATAREVPGLRPRCLLHRLTRELTVRAWCGVTSWDSAVHSLAVDS